MISARHLTLICFPVAAFTYGAEITRGPYLQSASPTSMVVRWRTDTPADTVLRYGTNGPDRLIVDETETIEHEVHATGLQPDTRYYYSIGTSDTTLASGTNYHFRTSPTNTRPVRVWVIGDSGSSDEHAAAVRDSYAFAARGTRTDLWLMLGDNAYGSGTDDEYQTAVFDMYPGLLRQVPLWPTIGNHDTGDNFPPLERPPYLDIFTLPQNGECGGVPSGTEAYYSFDYANIHFVCLDSQMSSRLSTGAMAAWLKSDLAATDKDWIVAYWHHPPYTKGTHDSDVEFELVEMRENMLPILEDYGADLVLCGHSHVYERSHLIDRHYGNSWHFDVTNMVASSGVFRKPWGGMGAHGGTVYAVCGNSGAGGSGDFPRHPAMAVNFGGYGSMILDFDGLRLTGQFLRDYVEIDDTFYIDKALPGTNRPAIAVTHGTSGVVLSWPTSNPMYSLESASNLSVADWSTEAEQTSFAHGRSNFVTLPIVPGERFFRLRNAQ